MCEYQSLYKQNIISFQYQQIDDEHEGLKSTLVRSFL